MKMPSEFLVAVNVLESISAQGLDTYLDRLTSDAQQVDRDIEAMKEHLDNSLTRLAEECGRLIDSGESLSKELFEDSFDQASEPTYRTWARGARNRAESNQAFLISAQRHLTDAWPSLQNAYLELLKTHQLPLFTVADCLRPSRAEQQEFAVDMAANMLGFIPAASSAVSVFTLLKDCRAWLKRDEALAEQIKRLCFLLSLSEFVRFMSEEGRGRLQRSFDEEERSLERIKEILEECEGTQKNLYAERETLRTAQPGAAQDG